MNIVVFMSEIVNELIAQYLDTLTPYLAEVLVDNQDLPVSTYGV